MVGPNTGLVLGHYTKVLPRERRLVDVEAPDIIDWLRACVTAKDEQVRLAEDNSVTVASTRGTAHNGHDHPLRSCVAIPQVKKVEIVGSKTTACYIHKEVIIRDLVLA